MVLHQQIKHRVGPRGVPNPLVPVLNGQLASDGRGPA